MARVEATGWRRREELAGQAQPLPLFLGVRSVPCVDLMGTRSQAQPHPAGYSQSRLVPGVLLASTALAGAPGPSLRGLAPDQAQVWEHKNRVAAPNGGSSSISPVSTEGLGAADDLQSSPLKGEAGYKGQAAPGWW